MGNGIAVGLQIFLGLAFMLVLGRLIILSLCKPAIRGPHGESDVPARNSDAPEIELTVEDAADTSNKGCFITDYFLAHASMSRLKKAERQLAELQEQGVVNTHAMARVIAAWHKELERDSPDIERADKAEKCWEDLSRPESLAGQAKHEHLTMLMSGLEEIRRMESTGWIDTTSVREKYREWLIAVTHNTSPPSELKHYRERFIDACSEAIKLRATCWKQWSELKSWLKLARQLAAKYDELIPIVGRNGERAMVVRASLIAKGHLTEAAWTLSQGIDEIRKAIEAVRLVEQANFDDQSLRDRVKDLKAWLNSPANTAPTHANVLRLVTDAGRLVTSDPEMSRRHVIHAERLVSLHSPVKKT